MVLKNTSHSCSLHIIIELYGQIPMFHPPKEKLHLIVQLIIYAKFGVKYPSLILQNIILERNKEF